MTNDSAGYTIQQNLKTVRCSVAACRVLCSHLSSVETMRLCTIENRLLFDDMKVLERAALTILNNCPVCFQYAKTSSIIAALALVWSNCPTQNQFCFACLCSGSGPGNLPLRQRQFAAAAESRASFRNWRHCYFD